MQYCNTASKGAMTTNFPTRLRLVDGEITARGFLQNSPNDVYYHFYAIETFSFLIFFVPLHLDYGNFRKYDRITDSSHFV